MKPEFERHRLKRGEPRHAVNVLIPEDLYERLTAYAGAEGDNLSGLIVEGAVRVDQDRKSDPDYFERHAANIERRKREIRAELAALEQISPPRA